MTPGRHERIQRARERFRRRATLATERLERRLAPAGLAFIGPNDVVFEGERAEFTLRLSERSSQPETVFVTTSPGTATYGVDYMAPARQQILFAPGQTEQKFSITTLKEAVPRTEGIETFFVTATPANQSVSGPLTSTVRIADFQPKPSLIVADVTVREGDSGTSTATFAIKLSAPYAKRISVSYATRDGSATEADADYVAANGSLDFAAGETQKFVSITVNGDRKLEADETFSLVLSAPVNAGVVKSSGLCTIVNDEVDQPGFQIFVTYDSTVTASQKLVFERAAARWSQIITGDLPGVTDSGIFIDDVTISASVPAIDGPGGVLGQAGPRGFREAADNFLPYSGVMQFDSADVAALERSGELQAVILHEMGHVLGVGTLWDRRGFLQGTAADPIFTGSNALREYNALFGTTATGVPVENSGGPGTANAHWRESVFRTELMTGYLNSGVANPISRITVGQFQDLGYTVNYSAADSYTKPAIVADASIAAMTRSGAATGARTGGFPVLKRNTAVPPVQVPVASAPTQTPKVNLSSQVMLASVSKDATTSTKRPSGPGAKPVVAGLGKIATS